MILFDCHNSFQSISETRPSVDIFMCVLAWFQRKMYLLLTKTRYACVAPVRWKFATGYWYIDSSGEGTSSANHRASRFRENQHGTRRNSRSEGNRCQMHLCLSWCKVINISVLLLTDLPVCWTWPIGYWLYGCFRKFAKLSQKTCRAWLLALMRKHASAYSDNSEHLLWELV